MFAVPLEANPDSFNGLAEALGLETAFYRHHDVWGLDDELLALVPQPVEAVIMLFPTETKYEHPQRMKEDEAAERERPVKGRESIAYFRQKHGNHCGTIALLHALGNSPNLPIKDGPIKQLFQESRGLDPEESAALMDKTDVASLHELAAQTGQSAAPAPDADVDHHYCAFVNHQGQLLELDGRCHVGPISHGPVVNGDLLASTVPVIKKMIAQQETIGFNIMVIAPTQMD